MQPTNSTNKNTLGLYQTTPAVNLPKFTAYNPNTGINPQEGKVMTMGAKAKSPQINIKPTTNTLPSSQINTDGLLAQAKNLSSQVSQQLNQSKPTTPAVSASPTPTPQQQSQPSQQPQNTGLYGQYVQALANKAQPSQQFTDLTNQAQEAYKQAGTTNQVIQQQEQNALHNPNYSLDTGIGRAGQIAQNYGLMGQNALTQAQGLGTLAGVANTQQGLQQSALTSAAGLAAPQLTSYSNQAFNPVTGQFSGGQGLADAVNLQVQKLRAGTTSPQDAQAALSAYGQAGTNALQQALGPNFNFNVAGGSAAAQQANAATAGSAGVTANQSVFNKAYSDYTDLKNATQNVDQFGNLLVQNMGGINPSDVKYANQTIAQIRSQLSSQQQAAFDTTLAALKSKVSGLLSIGGNEIPTAITSDAQKILDGSLPVGGLNAVLQRIQAEGNILLNNQADKVNTAYSGVQGNNSSNQSSSDLYSF